MKKLLATILLFGIIFSGTQAVNASSKIDSRAMGVECPKCGGLATERLVGTSESTPKNKLCVHGKNGYDSVKTITYQYAIIHECGYYENTYTTSSTSITCNGY